jgi:long-chain acyl-CoA synthetase
VKRAIVNFVVKYVKKMVPAWQLPQHWDFNAALAMGGRLAFDKVTITSGDIAYLQYTGGTTGIARGAILSHSNLIANMLQLYYWVKPVLREDERQIVVTALPLYHIFSLTVNCLTFMLLGGNNVLITNPREMTDMIKQIRHLKFTVISGVNTLFNAMLHHPHFAAVDFSHLVLSVAGGMAVQKSVAERWKKVTGIALIEGYGLTEASPVVTANLLNLKEYSGSIGLPIPSTDVSIRDDDNNELPIGAEGELCVRGPQVMRGYWGSPEETQSVFTPDGWLRTGDIARIDSEGFLYIVDRKKDMIIVSGFNVYPNEVEDVIAKHPGVLEVAVIGVPDVQSGEMVKALVVKKDPNLTAQEIIDFCHESLTRYKVPRLVEFRDQLPKTNVGKILRRALRE